MKHSVFIPVKYPGLPIVKKKFSRKGKLFIARNTNTFFSQFVSESNLIFFPSLKY